MSIMSTGTKYLFLRALQIATCLGSAPGARDKFLKNFSTNVAELVVKHGTLTIDFLDYRQTPHFLPIPPSIGDGLFHRGVKQLTVQLKTNLEAREYYWFTQSANIAEEAANAIEEAVATSVRSLLLFRLSPNSFEVDQKPGSTTFDRSPIVQLSIDDKSKGVVRLDVHLSFKRN